MDFRWICMAPKDSWLLKGLAQRSIHLGIWFVRPAAVVAWLAAVVACVGGAGATVSTASDTFQYPLQSQHRSRFVRNMSMIMPNLPVYKGASREWKNISAQTCPFWHIQSSDLQGTVMYSIWGQKSAHQEHKTTDQYSMLEIERLLEWCECENATSKKWCTPQDQTVSDCFWNHSPTGDWCKCFWIVQPSLHPELNCANPKIHRR